MNLDFRYDYTKSIAEQIKENGYDVSVNYSKTNFGESHYLYVNLKDDYNRRVKIRISDHSVTNYNRIFDEIHLGFPKNENTKYSKETIESLLEKIRWKLERSKYFTPKDVIEKTKAYNVETENIKESDVLQRQFKTKKGKDMYIVTRTYDIPSISWIYNPTNTIYTTIRNDAYEKGGIINFTYTIGGL
jgi:hypothetical protein